MADPGVQAVLVRTVLKKIIMTINYNAGQLTIKKYLGDILQLHVRDHANLQLFIEDFYNFISYEVFTLLYTSDKNTFINGVGGRLTLADAELNLTYMEPRIRKNELRIGTFR